MLYFRMQKPSMGKKPSLCQPMWPLCVQKVPFENSWEPGKRIKIKMDQSELPKMRIAKWFWFWKSWCKLSPSGRISSYLKGAQSYNKRELIHLWLAWKLKNLKVLLYSSGVLLRRLSRRSLRRPQQRQFDQANRGQHQVKNLRNNWFNSTKR